MEKHVTFEIDGWVGKTLQQQAVTVHDEKFTPGIVANKIDLTTVNMFIPFLELITVHSAPHGSGLL